MPSGLRLLKSIREVSDVEKKKKIEKRLPHLQGAAVTHLQTIVFVQEW